MSGTVRMLEAVSLHVERGEGWLARVLAAVDGRLFRLESVVLEGGSVAGPMRITLVVGPRSATPDLLLQALRSVPGVHLAQLLPPWRRHHNGKPQPIATTHCQVRARRMDVSRKPKLVVVT